MMLVILDWDDEITRGKVYDCMVGGDRLWWIGDHYGDDDDGDDDEAVVFWYSFSYLTSTVHAVLFSVKTSNSIFIFKSIAFLIGFFFLLIFVSFI